MMTFGYLNSGSGQTSSIEDWLDSAESIPFSSKVSTGGSDD